MQSISKSRLKANMLRVFREIEASGEELIVTDRGRPTLRIQPIGRKKSVEEVFEDFQGRLVFHEDPNAPTVEEWVET